MIGSRTRLLKTLIDAFGEGYFQIESGYLLFEIRSSFIFILLIILLVWFLENAILSLQPLYILPQILDETLTFLITCLESSIFLFPLDFKQGFDVMIFLL